MTSSQAKNDSFPTLVVYALPGSEYCGKVIAALDGYHIPHAVEFVSFDPKTRAKELPSKSGSTLVPEMKVIHPKEGENDEENTEVVKDSEVILHWLDNNIPSAKGKLFPTKQAEELSARASNKTLAACVWYYNWVDPAGYNRSMRYQVESMIPSVICFLRRFLVDWALSSEREKKRANILKAIDGITEETIKDEQQMRAMLIQELKYFQSCFTEPPDSQPYFVTKDHPSAVDFSVYAQVNRLVGVRGAADVAVDPSLPQLYEVDELSRLWEWHKTMCEHYPIIFKGKRLKTEK